MQHNHNQTGSSTPDHTASIGNAISCLIHPALSATLGMGGWLYGTALSLWPKSCKFDSGTQQLLGERGSTFINLNWTKWSIISLFWGII